MNANITAALTPGAADYDRFTQRLIEPAEVLQDLHLKVDGAYVIESCGLPEVIYLA